MQWWLSPSHELPGDAAGALLRAFIEVSRRAEITALINSAQSEVDLAEVVTEELCEACDAEIAFILGSRTPLPAPRVVSSLGLTGDEPARVARDSLCVSSFESHSARVHSGADLLGLGARNLLLAPFHGLDGDRVVVGVARLYEQAFDSAEVALVEAVTRSVGHALERLWNREELLRAQAKVIDALLPAQFGCVAGDRERMR
jgi:uncharacterized membrane protein